MSNLIQVAEDYTLDSIKEQFPQVIWYIEKDSKGETVKKISQVKVELEASMGKVKYEEEVNRRAVTVVLNFKGVTLKEILSAHRSQTTFAKLWYNNESIATLSYDEAEALIAEAGKHRGKLEISVRALLDRPSKRKEKDPDKATAKLLETLAKLGFSKEEILEKVSSQLAK